MWLEYLIRYSIHLISYLKGSRNLNLIKSSSTLFPLDIYIEDHINKLSQLTFKYKPWIVIQWWYIDAYLKRSHDTLWLKQNEPFTV